MLYVFYIKTPRSHVITKVSFLVCICTFLSCSKTHTQCTSQCMEVTVSRRGCWTDQLLPTSLSFLTTTTNYYQLQVANLVHNLLTIMVRPPPSLSHTPGSFPSRHSPNPCSHSSVTRGATLGMRRKLPSVTWGDMSGFLTSAPPPGRLPRFGHTHKMVTPPTTSRWSSYQPWLATIQFFKHHSCSASLHTHTHTHTYIHTHSINRSVGV